MISLININDADFPGFFHCQESGNLRNGLNGLILWEDNLFFPEIEENFMGMNPQKFPGIPIEKYQGSILNKHEALV